MASVKEYAYFLKGNKVSIVERDTSFDNDVNSRDYGPGSHRAKWKSPLSSVTNGLEIEYTYSPSYWINDVSDTVAVTAYTEASGLLSLTLATSSFTAGDYVLIRGSEEINGLHKVNATTSSSTSLVLTTKYSGGAVTESSTLYQDVDVLNDESDEIPLRPYQIQALECYIRAKLAMDIGEIQMSEYYMKEFRKKMEKDESGRIWGARLSSAGPHSIR